jgi:hypothetical protein
VATVRPVLITSFTASSLYSGVNRRRVRPIMNILSYEVSTKRGQGHACAQLVQAQQQVTFTAVADLAKLGRATLYRDVELRAVIVEHRTRQAEARTLSGLSHEIAHLRTALQALADNVRRHEEHLRRLERRTNRKNG